ncbi:MAG: phosphatidate cytidylyltransferase [Burkholderiales bacterium]
MLATRIVSALVLGAIVLAALFFLSPTGWALFSVLILLISGWEWGGFAGLATTGRAAMALTLGALCWAAAVWTGLSTGAPVAGRSTMFYGVAAVFWLVASPLWLARAPVRSVPLVIAACYIVMVPTYVAFVELPRFGPHVFLLIGAVVWIADVAAYFTGRRFGQRKLAPSISPGKSWEGVWGALAAVALYAVVAAGPLRTAVGATPASTPTLLMIFAALALTGLAVVGDLFESTLKRQAGVKDSGRIMPGHGGILDRIDAMLPVLPLAMLGILALRTLQ